jgi:Zn-dependent protease
MDPVAAFFVIPIIFFSVVLHEIAHGYVALRLGDETAARMGRLSLNPVVHVDPLGTVIVPVLLIVLKSPVLFAWAKPVPVDPRYFKKPKEGMVWVSLAGPATNLALAVVLSVLFHVLRAAGLLPVFLGDALRLGIILNLVLMTFNLIPIPPLDGSKVLAYFLKGEAYTTYMEIERYGMIIIVIMLYSGAISGIMTPVLSFALHILGIPWF